MSGEWREKPLSGLCLYINRGSAPAYIEDGGLPVLNQKCIRDHRVNFQEARRTDQMRKAILTERMLRPWDVLVNSTGMGTLGRVAQVRALPEPATVDSHVTIIRPDPKLVHPQYLGFVLRLYEREIEALAEGSTGQTELSRSRLASLAVPLAPEPEQIAIAHILGTLDDKIELNRRMNETLEAMARAIFKSWFVDFDPVRAKAEGRDTGLPKYIADLFPDSFEDSELGDIPEGWKVGTLGDIAEHPRRGVQPDEVDPETPYIALEHMPRCCIALSEWGVADGLESNKFRFRTGEILFGKLRPYFHKVGVAPVDGICSTDIVVVTPKSPPWFGLMLSHISSVDFVEYTNAGSTGTKMPRTSWSDMAHYEVVLPPENLAEVFTNQVRPIVDRILHSIHQSRTLSALRDALLPKLISGALRVKEVEKVMEVV